MIALFILIGVLTSTATAQDYFEAPVVVDDELRLMTAVFFLFFAVVIVGTYTTHHWEAENRGRVIGTFFRFGPIGLASGAPRPMGDAGLSFFIAKLFWWILYSLWALALYFIWITKDQQSWVWWWSWVLFGVALLLDKIWPYIYFYTENRNQIAGIGVAVISIGLNLIASLIIWFGQYWFFGGVNLLVGNILLDVFIALYFLFVINLGFTSDYGMMRRASAQMYPSRMPTYG